LIRTETLLAMQTLCEVIQEHVTWLCHSSIENIDRLMIDRRASGFKNTIDTPEDLERVEQWLKLRSAAV